VNTGAVHDLRPVGLYCLDGQAQPSGDFAGGASNGEHLQHLTLAPGKTPEGLAQLHSRDDGRGETVEV